jgi:hypothetical protein
MLHPLLPRFCPLQRLASHGEPHKSGESHLIRLSCALRVSHPLDALLPPRPARLIPSWIRSWGPTLQGFTPLSGAVRPLERRCPPGVGNEYVSTHTLLQGLSHQTGFRTLIWGLVRTQRQMPPWAFSPLRLLVHGSGRRQLKTTIPSHAFHD